MRVFSLGGAGHVGRYVAEALAKEDLVTEVAIAGRDLEVAKLAAKKIGQKASAVKVDGTDPQILAEAAKGFDMIVNTAGPDHVMQYPAILGALGARVHYCDIAADGLTTERVLGLSEEARDAGTTAVIGIGSYPGLSNMMMTHAMSMLDSVEEVHLHSLMSILALVDNNPGEAAEEMRRTKRVSASWQTVIQWFTSPGKILRNGRLENLDPLEDRGRTVLEDKREVTTCYLSTTEPVTLARTFKDLREASVSATLVPTPLNDLMLRLGSEMRAGKMNNSEATLRFLEAVRDDPERWLANPEGLELGRDGLVSIVSAKGMKNGRPARAVLRPTLDWLSTAQPLSVTAMRILRNQVPGPGIFPPEACLDPLPFMQEIASRVRGRDPPGEMFRTSVEYL